MRMLLAAAVLALASTDANALTCHMTDTLGNNLTYAFGPNTHNINGTFGGTLVETGFDKNGRSTFSQVGTRPIWIYQASSNGAFDLISAEAPGWVIHIYGDGEGAQLRHNGRFAGDGWCEGDTPSTRGGVPDQGIN